MGKKIVASVQLSIKIEYPAEPGKGYLWEPGESVGDTRELTNVELLRIRQFMDCPPSDLIDRLIAIMKYASM